VRASEPFHPSTSLCLPEDTTRNDHTYEFSIVRSRFFWEGVGEKRKYHMVDWATVCKPKEYGGLGVLNTRLMNIAFLLKWIWKLYQGAEGLWVDILKAKYLGDRDIFAHETPQKGSQFWSALQNFKWYFKLGARHHVKNGNRIYFWLDWWSGNTPLRDRYPQLFDCCAFPYITVRASVQRAGGQAHGAFQRHLRMVRGSGRL
jgi:hypothetical protein